jgi:hypothetical protein
LGRAADGDLGIGGVTGDAVGIGFTVGTIPGRIDPEYLRVVNIQANIVLVLMAAVHEIHAVFFAWKVRGGHWLVRFGGALAGSSALMVLLGYLLSLWWPAGWPEPMASIVERLVRALARSWDSA